MIHLEIFCGHGGLFFAPGFRKKDELGRESNWVVVDSRNLGPVVVVPLIRAVAWYNLLPTFCLDSCM